MSDANPAVKETPIDKMPIARIFFSKTKRAKYISHLDTMRTMSRAFRRSGLPVWYTQGFNPHIYINFPLPIALGYESLCESMDIRLTRETDFGEIVRKLNKSLPPGFEAIKAAVPVLEPKEIAWADYDVKLVYPDRAAFTALEKLGAFMKLPVIEVSKRTKKGDKVVDIKPLSQVLSSIAENESLHVTLRMAAGITLNVNPSLTLKEFYAFSGLEPDGVKITRTAIMTKNLTKFE